MFTRQLSILENLALTVFLHLISIMHSRNFSQRMRLFICFGPPKKQLNYFLNRYYFYECQYSVWNWNYGNFVAITNLDTVWYWICSTITVMTSLVALSFYGASQLKFHWVERYDKLLVGSVLCLVGILTLLFHDHDHHHGGSTGEQLHRKLIVLWGFLFSSVLWEKFRECHHLDHVEMDVNYSSICDIYQYCNCFVQFVCTDSYDNPCVRTWMCVGGQCRCRCLCICNCLLHFFFPSQSTSLWKLHKYI